MSAIHSLAVIPRLDEPRYTERFTERFLESLRAKGRSHPRRRPRRAGRAQIAPQMHDLLGRVR
jgi:hypothetical protein